MTSSSLRLLASVASTSLILALAAGSAAAQSNATAQGQQSVVLDTIVVEGQGGQAAAPLVDGPTTTTTTRQELDRQQVQDLSDLANRVEAGIGFNRTTNSVNIRGLEGVRVLTTIDGIRIPYLLDATRGATGGGNAFDFDALSTLDLLRGTSGASTLGSGALGGALALRTLDPKDLIRAHSNFGALAKLGYDSTDRAFFASAAGAARAGNTYALIQGSYRKGHETVSKGTVDALGATRTKPNPEDFKQYSFLAKVHHYVDNVHRFGITGEFFKRNEDIDSRTSQSLTGQYRFRQYFSGEDVERKRVSLSYDYNLPGGWLDRVSAVAYWQDIKRNSTVDSIRSTSLIGPYLRDNETSEKTWGLNAFGEKEFQTGPLSHKLTFGGELRISQFEQYSAGVDACRRPYTGAFTACNNLHTNQADTPKVDGKAIGLYVHDEIALLDRRLRITPGLRFDWYEEKPQYTAEFARNPNFTGMPKSSSDQAVSPRVRIEYDIVPKLTAFAQWSMGFRAPTAGELYGQFGAVGTYLRRGNPDLKPETSNGIDIGLKYGDRDLGGSLTYFNTGYRNFIDTVIVEPNTTPGTLYPQGGITQTQNLARVRIEGFEANAHWRFHENWTVRGSFSYMRGQNQVTKAFIDTIPPVQGIVAVAYNAGNVWGGELSAKLAGARDDVNQGFKAPGYAVFNASAWWRPMPDLELNVGVYNIFDRKYFDALTIPLARAQARDYYSEPGRTVKATLKYQF